MMTNIFVFGSNLAGRHGKGAALYAYKYRGAKYGQGVGAQGTCYAIPTKDEHLNTLPLEAIETYIKQFLLYASQKIAQQTFTLTPIGCGLAGYKKEQILAILRKHPIPKNVSFSKEWFDL
jgi:hypothetical protein